MTNTTSATERVGRYQLLDPIGVGPSGAVSRAKVFGVAGFERQFAVKRFHTELTATAAMAAMLSAAARAYGSLEHPRIARMSEFGVAQGSTFTAVEYVLGLDALRLIGEARLAGATLAAGGALALVSQAARAVGYAHGRGLTHLGLAPTNVIVTAEGDIKITDFGLLSATLPQRPIEVPRLAQRIPYLAPEQLANEATSAATDVFALGVLAYELVTGHRTFKGETPQQVASAIMAGPPAEPPLPRPIVRVLQRCLARSPFERFPDARALADALDAALRVAPVPGTRKDIGAQVKETLDRLAALNEGQMSGVVALHLGTGPIRRPDDDVRRRAQTQGRDPEPGESDEPTRPGPPPGGGPLTVRGGPATVGGPVTVGGGPVTVGGPLSSGGPATVGGPLSSGGPATVGGPLSSGGPATVGGPLSSGPATVGGPLSSGGPATVGGPLSSGPATVGGPLSSGGLATVGGPLSSGGLATVGGPLSSGGPATTLQDLPRYPITTVTGLPPPPIAVPTGIASSTNPSSGPPIPSGTSTLHGMGQSPPVPPPTRPSTRPGSSSGLPSAKPPAVPAAARRAGTRPGTDLSVPLEPASSVTSDSQVHTLDPNDLVSIDSGVVDVVELNAIIDGAPEVASGATAQSSGATAQPSSPPTRPSSPPTRPSSPAAQASALPDPVARRSEPKLPSPASDASATLDDDHGFDAEDARAAGDASPDLPDLDDDPRLGQTILGFAAPVPRAPTPAPFTPIPRAASDRAQTADERAEPPVTGQYRRPATPIPPAQQHDAIDPQPEEPASSTPPPPTQPAIPPGWVTTPPLPIAPSDPAMSRAGRPSRRVLWIAVGMLGVALASVGAWQIYLRMATPTTSGGGSDPLVAVPGDAPLATPPTADATAIAVAATPDATTVAVAPADATTNAVALTPDATTIIAVAPADAARPAPADAARVAIAAPDAGTPPSDARPAPTDAAQVVAANPTPTAPSDALSIASSPPGARVFLDGSDTGATPLKLPGSPDRHTIALLLAGHELYVAQVDGHGAFQIPLKEVTPANGPAGIKVLRCKDKDRYYVFIDGKHTGQTCPTERIGCEIGPHTVEVYDVVSETRRKWDIVVKDTRLSFRVRVE